MQAVVVQPLKQTSTDECGGFLETEATNKGEWQTIIFKIYIF